MNAMTVDAWEPTQWRLYTLLRAAATGLVTRHGDAVWFEGAPANLTVALAVSVLDKRGLVFWWPEHPDSEGCCPSVAGDALLRRWDEAVLGPALTPVASERPLLCPPCLADATGPWLPGDWDRRLWNAIHTHEPTDETDQP